MRPVFWFDFNSPFVYLAAERIDPLIPDAEWRPFAFPLMLGAQGRLEEAMGRDPHAAIEAASGRIAERGLPPLALPAGWPAATWSLHPLRAAVYADEQGRMREFVRVAYRRFCAEGLVLSEVANLRAAAEAAGLDPDAVLDAIERPDIKQRVKDNTDAAIARGLPGIPTVEVGGELVWGDDRLDEAAALAERADGH
ncbi:MAG TPA: DsbA family protein [Thermoleophilaceae bacterium]|jgi:2-hydroxychromene-2-carboxylate isomerase